MEINQITQEIIGAAIEVHKNMGPGLLESTYEECLCREFTLRQVRYERQKTIPLEYKGINLDCGYRLDLLVEDMVVIEVKALSAILSIHEAQVLTYLKLSKKNIGLLINFNVPLLKDGIRRIVHNLKE